MLGMHGGPQQPRSKLKTFPSSFFERSRSLVTTASFMISFPNGHPSSPAFLLNITPSQKMIIFHQLESLSSRSLTKNNPGHTSMAQLRKLGVGGGVLYYTLQTLTIIKYKWAGKGYQQLCRANHPKTSHIICIGKTLQEYSNFWGFQNHMQLDKQIN